ncbi:MAG: Hsp20/alpha crystallin family protein [Pseudomonadales bacterium]
MPRDKEGRDKDVAVKSEKARPPATADQRFEQLFDEFFNRRWPSLFGSRWPSLRWPELESLSSATLDAQTPKVDVIDRENEVLVRAELPGIAKEDIDVSVSDNTVTIKGSSRKETESDKDQYHRREIVSSYVSRTVPLAAEVNGDAARATLKDGLLEVTIPKVEKSKRKRIEIQS